MRRLAANVDTVSNKPLPDGLSSEELDGVIGLCFTQPQAQLANRDKVNKARLDNVAVLAVRLETDAPSTKSTMLNDPVTIRLGLKNDTALVNLDDEKLKRAFDEIKKRDSSIGGWTLVYDIRPEHNEKRPTWRLATEVRPSSVTGMSLMTDGGGKLLCMDVKGVGVFVGRQRKSSLI
jgi:hypothetical protein